MSKIALPSLEQLIRRRIRGRIVLAMLILVGAASLLTVAEAGISVSKRMAILKERAAKLQDLVTSELLVHNATAVDAILADTNVEHPEESVRWIPPESAQGIDAESFQWRFSGRWTFMTPLRAWGDQKFGAFVFTGNLLKEDALISLLTYRALYVVLFCTVLCALLLPVARNAPNDLILKPVRRLLSLVGAQRDDAVSIVDPTFSEIKDLENELRLLLAERRLREDEQIEAEQNKAITHAAQMLAHDIRRPFALLKAALDGMAQARTPEAAKRLADRTMPRVTNAFSTLDAMLDELMMLGRPRVIPAARVDMRRVVEQAAEAVTALHPGIETRASYSIEPDLFVHGHAGDLQRVLSNLIANALQAMSPIDTLRVGGWRENGAVKIRVENTGSYIPAEEQASIFKLFYTKGKASGSGIGLAICKRIVSDHHGKIAVESGRERGTAFVISIPTAPAPDVSTTRDAIPSASAPKVTGARRLLIVDDDDFFLDALENAALTIAGTGKPIEVTAASTAEDAVRLAIANKFDGIVIDLDFGDGHMDGITAVRLMRCEGITSTICVHTSNATQTCLNDAMQAGANAFVPKPMAQEALRSVLG